MSSGEIERSDQSDTDARLSEVEFALVLSRIIDSVSDDKEKLRQTIYDLARYKLREQLEADGDARLSQRSQDALEVAIRGVEAFSNRGPNVAALSYQARPHEASSADYETAELIARSLPAPDFDEAAFTVVSSPVKIPRQLGSIGRVAGFIVILIALLGAIRYRETLLHVVDAFKTDKSIPLAQSAPVKAEPTPAVPVAAKPSALLPTNFGVYGVSDGKLFELNLLPSRAQDMRIAITPTTATSNEPVFANGRVKFVVYRREAALSIPERAEVRIIAKVAHAITFDAGGKPVTSADDAWYIRNISFPFRVSPIKENAEMFEIRPEDDKLELSPGRYALVIKGQVYDFIIGGQITDTRHCLERITAANGTFVSECKKL